MALGLEVTHGTWGAPSRFQSHVSSFLPGTRGAEPGTPRARQRPTGYRLGHADPWQVRGKCVPVCLVSGPDLLVPVPCACPYQPLKVRASKCETPKPTVSPFVSFIVRTENLGMTVNVPVPFRSPIHQILRTGGRGAYPCPGPGPVRSRLHAGGERRTSDRASPVFVTCARHLCARPLPSVASPPRLQPDGWADVPGAWMLPVPRGRQAGDRGLGLGSSSTLAPQPLRPVPASAASARSCGTCCPPHDKPPTPLPPPPTPSLAQTLGP